jgi:hypothetical protein
MRCVALARVSVGRGERGRGAGLGDHFIRGRVSGEGGNEQGMARCVRRRCPPLTVLHVGQPGGSPRDRERMSKYANTLQTTFWKAKLAPVVPYRG